jgi:hypothetical protein
MISSERVTDACSLYADVSEHSVFHLHNQVDIYPVVKYEQTECFETSAYKIQMPVDHPEENL